MIRYDNDDMDTQTRTRIWMEYLIRYLFMNLLLIYFTSLVTRHPHFFLFFFFFVVFISFYLSIIFYLWTWRYLGPWTLDTPWRGQSLGLGP